MCTGTSSSSLLELIERRGAGCDTILTSASSANMTFSTLVTVGALTGLTALLGTVARGGLCLGAGVERIVRGRGDSRGGLAGEGV